jgi:peptidoglycan/xylan/chitin deacetylase (PgdA/CDA1 family)
MLLITLFLCWQAFPFLAVNTPTSTSTSGFIAEASIAISSRFIIPVICYHKFSEKPNGDWTISTRNFTEQLRYLSEHNFHSISLDNLQSLLAGKMRKLDYRPIVITVDDGYKSFRTIAYPLLKKYGFKAVLFPPTDFISSGPGALSWSDLQDFSREGFEIGSHTKSHLNLIGNTIQNYQRKLEQELAEPIEIIERKLKIPVIALAFPYGNYDNQIKKLAKTTGYKMLFTCNEYPNTEQTDPYCLGRFSIYGSDTLQNFIAEVNALPLNSSRQQPADGSLAPNAPVIVSAIIDDKKIDTSTLAMYIRGVRVPADFDAKTRMISYLLGENRKEKAYNVTIRAREIRTERCYFTAWFFRRN